MMRVAKNEQNGKQRRVGMLIKRALSRLSRYGFVQEILNKNVRISQFLMGVGSGSDVSSSGEIAIFDLLKSRARSPYCIFDVGANQGQFVKLALEHVPADGLSIHCFEPGLTTFQILTRVCGSLKQTDRLQLHNFGLGAERRSAVLHFDSVGSGLASLTKRNLDHHGIDFENSEAVEIRTIDDYCEENGLSRIDLLKIDIEGHELDALKGGRRMLESNAVGMVSFEFGGCNIDTRTYFRDFFYFFAEVNMSILRIAPSGYLTPIKTYNESLEQFGTTNFIAVSNA